ncbi:MAG: HEAT repeat domain-containing protein [Gammaproteobacteria bacterium SHHR-1]
MNPIPQALLLIATGCSHCPVMLDQLSKLLKQGRIGRLELINISQLPEQAQRLGVRSVPWWRLDEFVFTGVMQQQALEEFVQALSQGRGHQAYLLHLLGQGQLPQAVEQTRQRPDLLGGLIPLLGDLQRPMALRIGIGALIEEIGTDPALLAAARPPLRQLLGAADSQVRADACHYLGVLGDDADRPLIQPLLQDDNPEVREIAAETLALLDTDGP